MDDAAENERLVRIIAAGGDGAHGAEKALCARFTLRAELYGRKHLRDADAARDLSQAAMLAVIQAARRGKIEDAARLDRFVLGTCRNIALRMLKTRERAQPTEAEKLDAVVVEPDLGAVDVGALLRCLSALEPRARRIVYLSFHDEKTADEIGAVLSTTAGNVRVLRHRAVLQLRRCMDDCAEGGR
jgi:RNA polymerase sigma-70 factor (ECF subfamily)